MSHEEKAATLTRAYSRFEHLFTIVFRGKTFQEKLQIQIVCIEKLTKFIQLVVSDIYLCLKSCIIRFFRVLILIRTKSFLNFFIIDREHLFSLFELMNLVRKVAISHTYDFGLVIRITRL